MDVDNTFSESSNVSILFRCDAGTKHGLGHLSRCMTLAEVLAKSGFYCGFVIHAPEQIQWRIQDAGFGLRSVPVPVGPDDEPANWIDDNIALIIIDSKENTANYTSQCRKHCLVICFDDEIARDLPCDALINNHPLARESDYPINQNRRLLIGQRFNTVNAGYFEFRHERHGLLVTMGGEDPHNHTVWLIECLADLMVGLPVLISIGPAHPDPESIVRVCRSKLPSAELHFAPPSLLTLMERCHIALTAAGITCYELAASGVAFAVLAVEEHQASLAAAMVAAGTALPLGKFDALHQSAVRKTFIKLCQVETVSALSARGRALFVQAGTPAIVEEISKLLNTPRTNRHL